MDQRPGSPGMPTLYISGEGAVSAPAEHEVAAVMTRVPDQQVLWDLLRPSSDRHGNVVHEQLVSGERRCRYRGQPIKESPREDGVLSPAAVGDRFVAALDISVRDRAAAIFSRNRLRSCRVNTGPASRVSPPE